MLTEAENGTERTNLLVHLIMQTPIAEISNPPESTSQNYVGAAELLDSLEERRSDIKPSKWPIIQEIIRVRSLMESCKAGELGRRRPRCGSMDADRSVDGTTMTSVIDYSESTRRALGETEADIADDDDADAAKPAGMLEPDDCQLDGSSSLTPLSSAFTSPVASNLPLGNQMTAMGSNPRAAVSDRSAPLGLAKSEAVQQRAKHYPPDGRSVTMSEMSQHMSPQALPDHVPFVPHLYDTGAQPMVTENPPQSTLMSPNDLSHLGQPPPQHHARPLSRWPGGMQTASYSNSQYRSNIMPVQTPMLVDDSGDYVSHEYFPAHQISGAALHHSLSFGQAHDYSGDFDSISRALPYRTLSAPQQEMVSRGHHFEFMTSPYHNYPPGPLS